MKREKGLLKPEARKFAWTGAVLAAGAIALFGCGSDERRPAAATSTSAAVPTETRPKTSQTNPAETATLVFDDLQGGSTIVQVYPGTSSDKPADRVHNGTYNDGESVAAECKTEGRTVESDPSVGEENRSSNDWIRLQTGSGEAQYATAVYVESPYELLGQLQDC